jgi:thiol-disulfide isomerase/thioredoxin
MRGGGVVACLPSWRSLSGRRGETLLDAKTGLDTSVEAAGTSACATKTGRMRETYVALGVVACAALALAAVAGGAVPPSAGALAPLDQAGYQRLVAANKGHVALVDFWATWCDPCRAEMPQLVRLAARYQARGLRLLTVSCDEPEQEASAAAFLKQNQAPPPRYVKHAANDEKFIDSIDSKWSGALPALFLYDRQGRLVKSFIGETSMATVEAEIKRTL